MTKENREEQLSKLRGLIKEGEEQIKENGELLRKIKILDQKLDEREQKLVKEERKFMMIINIGKEDPDMLVGMLKKFLRQLKMDKNQKLIDNSYDKRREHGNKSS